MFEIVITEEQLINTLTFLKSSNSFLGDSKRNSVLTVFNECKFIAITKNSEQFFKKLKLLGEDIIRWAGNQLGVLNDLSEIEPNPFRIIITSETNNLFDFDFSDLLEEKEYIVKAGESPTTWNLSSLKGELAFETIIYDPFFIQNMERSVCSISTLFKEFRINVKSKLLIIGSPNFRMNFVSDRDIENIYNLFEEKGFDKNNIFIMSIKKEYHDRDLICNILRIKSGGSFDFMRPDSDVFHNENVMTFDLKSLLKSSRYNEAWKILDLLMSACEIKYLGKRLITDGEKKAAEGFDLTSIYKYWSLNKG